MVGRAGLEPATLGLRVPCTTSCANGPAVILPDARASWEGAPAEVPPPVACVDAPSRAPGSRGGRGGVGEPGRLTRLRTWRVKRPVGVRIPPPAQVLSLPFPRLDTAECAWVYCAWRGPRRVSCRGSLPSHAPGGACGRMKVEWRTEPGSRAVLEIEVAEEEVAQAMDQAYTALVRRVRIPGFRPGKAPRPILERHVGTETLRDEALRRLIPRQYAEALAQAGLNPVDTPTIEVKEGPGGKGLRLTATVDVYPEVTLPDYRALRVPRESREVTEEDVDRALGDLRSRHGRLVSLPPGEPARRGDFVMIRVTASPPGLERLQPGRELLVEVGGGLLPPELEETLEGVRAEDVRRKELPSLDDAFARAVSDQPTVAALREQLRARLAQERASEEARAFRNRVIDAVLSHTAVDVPESMVEHQVEHMVEELRERLRGRGLTLESYLAAAGKDESALRAEMKPEAERRVRVRLVLDAVAAREALTVSEQEMAAEVENLASELHQDVAKVQAWLAEEGRREALRRSLLRQKALTFLVDVVSGSPPAAGAAEAPAADPATRTPG